VARGEGRGLTVRSHRRVSDGMIVRVKGGGGQTKERAAGLDFLAQGLGDALGCYTKRNFAKERSECRENSDRRTAE